VTWWQRIDSWNKRGIQLPRKGPHPKYTKPPTNSTCPCSNTIQAFLRVRFDKTSKEKSNLSNSTWRRKEFCFMVNPDATFLGISKSHLHCCKVSFASSYFLEFLGVSTKQLLRYNQTANPFFLSKGNQKKLHLNVCYWPQNCIFKTF